MNNKFAKLTSSTIVITKMFLVEEMNRAKRRKIRYTCPHCNQSLAHTAYQHHTQLPQLYCHALRIDSSSDSDSTFIASDSSQDMNVEQSILDSDIDVPIATDGSTESTSSTDTAPEVWEHSSDVDEGDSSDQTEETRSPLKYMLCVFLAFFQLCFHVSDRAMLHLLGFFSAFISYLSSKAKDATVIKLLGETLPKTLYSLRKVLKLEREYTKYIVCPR